MPEIQHLHQPELQHLQHVHQPVLQPLLHLLQPKASQKQYCPQLLLRQSKLAPLQSKVNAMNLELQEMGRLPPGVETESEEESEKEAEGMEVDGKSKRPLEEECSNIVTLRRSKMLERPARTPRR